MASRKAPRLIHSPTQARSRATHDAILRAFRQALAATPYDDISIADLAQRADVSVGGFYARFTSKDALLLPLVEDTLASLVEALDGALDEVQDRQGSVADVTHAYVSVMVHGFRQHSRVLQQVLRSAKGDVASAIGERVHAFNEHAHHRFRTLLWERRKEIRHRSPRSAIEIALFTASAAGREAVTPGIWKSYALQPDDAALIRELTAIVVAYLTAR